MKTFSIKSNEIHHYYNNLINNSSDEILHSGNKIWTPSLFKDIIPKFLAEKDLEYNIIEIEILKSLIYSKCISGKFHYRLGFVIKEALGIFDED